MTKSIWTHSEKRKQFLNLPEVDYYQCFFPKKTKGHALLQQHPLLEHKQCQ